MCNAGWGWLKRPIWPSSLVLCFLGGLSSPPPLLAADPCERAWEILASTSRATHVLLAKVHDRTYVGEDPESIQTFVRLAPIQILKGKTSPDSLVTVRHWGGRYPNGHWAWNPELPSFTEADTVLVLLTPTADKECFRVVGARYGKYEVHDGRFSSRELAGLSVGEGLLCLMTIIEARSPRFLAAEADVICICDVVSREIALDSVGEKSTITTLSVVDALKGAALEAVIRLQQAGDVTKSVERGWDQPLLALQKRYVLFLAENSDGTYEIVGGIGGSYRVEGDTVVKHDIPLRELLGKISSD